MDDKKRLVRKLRKVRASVELLLRTAKKKDEYKDNDEKLVAKFLAIELRSRGFDLKKMTAEELLAEYAKGSITPIDLIIRARRKAQELNMDCRGTRWNERHGLSTSVKDDIDET